MRTALASIQILLFVVLAQLTFSRIEIIGHRGAPGYRPEHTYASHEMAINFGVDYTEIDLQMTKDGELVVAHSHQIGEITNIASLPQFADRKRHKYNVGGESLTGWFTQDFTLNELTRDGLIRPKERFPNRVWSQAYNFLYTMMSFKQMLQLINATNYEIETLNQNSKTLFNDVRSEKFRRNYVGIYMETKKAYHYSLLGIDMEKKLLENLAEFDYVRFNSIDGKYHWNTDPKKKIIIESFESTSIKRVRDRCPEIPTVMLINNNMDIQNDTGRPFGELVTEEGVKYLAEEIKATGLGPTKGLLGFPNTKPTNLVNLTHKYKMIIHPWTCRSDQMQADWKLESDIDEYIWYFKMGIDGIFSDFPDRGLLAREIFERGPKGPEEPQGPYTPMFLFLSVICICLFSCIGCLIFVSFFALVGAILIAVVCTFLYFNSKRMKESLRAVSLAKKSQFGAYTNSPDETPSSQN